VQVLKILNTELKLPFWGVRHCSDLFEYLLFAGQIPQLGQMIIIQGFRTTDYDMGRLQKKEVI
jgi:hypothetical protein